MALIKHKIQRTRNVVPKDGNYVKVSFKETMKKDASGKYVGSGKFQLTLIFGDAAIKNLGEFPIADKVNFFFDDKNPKLVVVKPLKDEKDTDQIKLGNVPGVPLAKRASSTWTHHIPVIPKNRKTTTYDSQLFGPGKMFYKHQEGGLAIVLPD